MQRFVHKLQTHLIVNTCLQICANMYLHDEAYTNFILCFPDFHGFYILGHLEDYPTNFHGIMCNGNKEISLSADRVTHLQIIAAVMAS